MLPESDARRTLLCDHNCTLRVLRPPYAAIGIGSLRVLRVRETQPGRLEITAGYENYGRLEG
jgi:hypothetical protein